MWYNHTMISTAENWKRINEAVAFEAERCGRKPEEVKVMAVTKLHAAEEIRPLIESGCCLFGENRLAESLEKWPQLNREGVSLHLIGHLQSNKAKAAVEFFDAVDSLDSLSTLLKVEKHAAAAGKRLSVLLEVNCSGEEAKHGFRDETEFFRAVEAAAGLEFVSVCGVMTMAALGADEKTARAAFARLRRLRDKAETESGLKLPELSMGMSGDFRQAVAEGSTTVRIGTALFEGVPV